MSWMRSGEAYLRGVVDQSKDRYYRPFPLVSIAGVEASVSFPDGRPGSTTVPHKQWIDPFTVNFSSPSFGGFPSIHAPCPMVRFRT
jgi:hypothetical protein